MTSTKVPQSSAGGKAQGSVREKVAALTACGLVAAGLIVVIYVFHAPSGVQSAAAIIAAALGATVLQRAFPGALSALAATVAVVALVLPHSAQSQVKIEPRVKVEPIVQTRTVQAPPANCPHTQNPIGQVRTDYPVENSHPASTSGLGAAHIDNVIAPDGSPDIKKYETVCITVQRYPTGDRQLWLMLRLREPAGGNRFYDLFYVVGALPDPLPGRYPIAIDRSCSALTTGDRHTLFVISAPASDNAVLWADYSARLDEIDNGACNSNVNGTLSSPPTDYYIASEQVDVIQD